MQFDIKDLIKQLNNQNEDDFDCLPVIKTKNKIKKPKKQVYIEKKEVQPIDNSNHELFEIGENIIEILQNETQSILQNSFEDDNSVLAEITDTIKTMSYRQFKDLVNKSKDK